MVHSDIVRTKGTMSDTVRCEKCKEVVVVQTNSCTYLGTTSVVGDA